MATSLDPEQAAADARQLLDDRVDAVRDLAHKAAHAERARDAAEAAERDFTTAHRAATQAGWTPTELRKIGIPNPRQRPPGRPRKRGTDTTAPTAPADNNEERNQ